MPQIMDARKLSTGEFVVLKKVSVSTHPHELEIAKYLSSEPFASHPRNHCVPLLDALYPPDDSDLVILVIPLCRSFDQPRFQTVGEVVEYLRQVFEV